MVKTYDENKKLVELAVENKIRLIKTDTKQYVNMLC